MWVPTICLIKHLQQPIYTLHKLLNLVIFIKEIKPNYHVALLSPIDKLEDEKAGLIIKD